LTQASSKCIVQAYALTKSFFLPESLDSVFSQTASSLLVSMAFSSSACSGALFCFISLILCSGAPHGHFRGRRATVASDTIKADLREIMEVSLKGGNGFTARRLTAIEASMQRSFHALPKNHMGHLAPRAVRHIVHTYFARRHGWIIKGLEPQGMQESVAKVHEATIFQDNAPALVEGLLQARHNDHGMSLRDVVLMAAVLERLIFDESIAFLRTSYYLNSLSATDRITEATLVRVLATYVLAFQAENQLTDIRPDQTLAIKSHMVDFAQDAVSNFQFAHRHSANPFKVPQYSFEDSALMMDDIADKFGVSQNEECSLLKETLMNLVPDRSGRIPLSRFYSQPPGNIVYTFTESKEYLRSIGALDESSSWGEPRVLLANYMAGPSNCLANSPYFLVCCISECEGVLTKLEEEIKAPSATPERLLAIVADLSTSSVEAPRVLPETLKERLTAIASRSESGEVFIHGRLFAQWLHYAFPNECAHPHASEDRIQYSHTTSMSAYDAAVEDRIQHIEEFAEVLGASTLPDIGDECSAIQWSDEEALPLLEPVSRRRSSMRNFVTLCAQLATLTAMVRIILSMWSSLASACGFFGKGKGGDGAFVLPTYA